MTTRPTKCPKCGGPVCHVRADPEVGDLHACVFCEACDITAWDSDEYRAWIDDATGETAISVTSPIEPDPYDAYVDAVLALASAFPEQVDHASAARRLLRDLDVLA